MGLVYKTPLSPLCQAGHYGAFIGEKYENLREFADLVEKQRENGADFIKVMISGLMDFDRFGVLSEEALPAAEIKELIHIAHEEGFSVMAHANGARCVEAAATAGVDSVEHGAYLNNEALSAMAENGVVWVPTLSTVANLLGKGRFPEDQVKKILECNAENVVAFHRMGGLIAPGSDAGAWAVPHGADTEYGLLAGLGIYEDSLNRGAAVIKEKF
jgi:imidazolonepropionase-like amidohydrolase